MGKKNGSAGGDGEAPARKGVKIEEVPSYYNSSGSSVNELVENEQRSPSPPAARRRLRTLSGSKGDNQIMTTKTGRRIYTKGRPPWYDRGGQTMKKPFVIGICGGSASGKTTVAEAIIERLEVPWVTILSMDSFYKVLNTEQKKSAHDSNFNFDHPDAFDFDLLKDVLARLKEGKSVEVPVYDFSTHSRSSNAKTMYGADVLIFEGILAFHREDINEMMDMKVFVDTDADTRLARRLARDISERGRDTKGVLDQYLRFVKPAFDTFIAPGTKVADIIVPRGGDNLVAIDLIVKRVKTELSSRGYNACGGGENGMAQQRSSLLHTETPHELPESLHIVKQTPQVLGLHTFIRNKDTKRDELIFYSERLMRILIEEALNFMPHVDVTVEVSPGVSEAGRRMEGDICGVAIMRAGETMENSLRSVVKDCKMGKILIQTNDKTLEPELYYLRLPKDIHKFKVLLLDATVASGAAAMMAIRILVDHDVPEENISILSLLMAEPGVHALAYAFPKVRLVTTAVDPSLSDQFYVLPGMGNFGDRYYGTEISDDDSDEYTGALSTPSDGAISE
ncbi:hypothetical protein PENTCL1PPCAC_18364 [Pristionchus entomophagus]|uniref:Uridine kinase n=1 Tax=Pristionchus entomophagus TaxID=358040 RepID=A0AAV5TQB4_9BILA|nr:hypothetical protein PENTCL1PPCAC_18364 [Pristionchus entomophagus]